MVEVATRDVPIALLLVLMATMLEVNLPSLSFQTPFSINLQV